MSYSYKLKSHPTQSLYDHLTGVRDIALKTHKHHTIKPEIDDFIEIVCMCHDFGKGTTYFQRYLENDFNGIEKDHGPISAMFTYWMLPDKWKHLGFLIVKKHHGDINNASDECRMDEVSWDFKKQIKDILDNTIDELNQIYDKYLEDKNIEAFLNWLDDESNLKSIKKEFRKKKYNIEDLLLCEYVYSLLLTGDKSQLIRNDAYIPDKQYPLSFIENYKADLVKDALIKNPKLKESDVFNLRNEIYDDMINKLDTIDFDKENIFSINVPTGTGKTILAYSAAFYICNKIIKNNLNIRPHIIYSLPFTSVIDQNYEVLKEIVENNINKEISSEDLMKFHSVVPIEYENFEGYDARFCFENWQSKIISTTFVQLLNTIFKIGKNSIVNRFHRLANSVIILDEVQAIDEKYYKIISEFISIMVRQYNCYIILVTATMPMLLDTIDLIEDKEKYFRKLNRIEIINNSESEITLDEFEDIVLEDIRENKDKSFLVVLNTVKSSKNIYKYLKKNTDRDIIYLSTEIYPKLRLEKIHKIKNSDKKYVVVSTQLIEAGVDIDMDIVYRDFSTLDSINQTAGRANRNGVGGKGIVKLYKIVDNDRRICNYIYPRYLLNATEEVLDGKDIIEEKDIYDCNKEYFLKVKNRLSNDTSDELLDLIPKLQFKKFRDKFELIENDEFRRVDIIVNADNITNSIIQQLENDDEIDNIDLKNKFRILRQYTVSVPRKDMSEINDIGLKKYNITYINKEDYSEEEGIIRQKQVIW